MQRARDDSQHAACNGRDATWDRRQAAQPMRHGTVGRASEDVRHATESVQRRHAKGQSARDQCNRQQTACNVRRRCNRRHAACNTTSRHHAPCSGRRSNRRLGFGSEEHQLVRATRARPRGGAVCPGLLSRLSPSSASNRSRKIRRLGCLSGPAWRRATLSRNARLPRAADRPIFAHDGACDRRTVNTAASSPKGVFQDDKGFTNTFL
jgi:hypothetical protein